MLLLITISQQADIYTQKDTLSIWARALPLSQVSHLYESESLFEEDAQGVSALKKGYEHVKKCSPC